MITAKRMLESKSVWEFVLAGNATVTLKSSRTGTRFTYRVRQSDNRGLYFVSLLTGSNNEHDYQYLGMIRDGKFSHGKKSRISLEAQSFKAFNWFWNNLEQRDWLHPELECWHEGRCGRCNRKLTVPESIESGLGPECRYVLQAVPGITLRRAA